MIYWVNYISFVSLKYMKYRFWLEYNILGIKLSFRNGKSFINYYVNGVLSLQMQNIYWVVGRYKGRIYERDNI